VLKKSLGSAGKVGVQASIPSMYGLMFTRGDLLIMGQVTFCLRRSQVCSVGGFLFTAQEKSAVRNWPPDFLHHES
jgi:hypothetical protein